MSKYIVCYIRLKDNKFFKKEFDNPYQANSFINRIKFMPYYKILCDYFYN